MIKPNYLGKAYLLYNYISSGLIHSSTFSQLN